LFSARQLKRSRRRQRAAEILTAVRDEFARAHSIEQRRYSFISVAQSFTPYSSRSRQFENCVAAIRLS